MTTATGSPLPNSMDLAQGWADYSATPQRLQAVAIDAARRLAEVRLEAGAEAYMEAFGHAIAVIAGPSPGSALVDWPARMLSAQMRVWRTQQACLDIWAHAMKATAEVLTKDGVDQAQPGAPVPAPVEDRHFIERRVSAVVINFADRRAPQAIGGPAERLGGDTTGVSARRHADALRR